MILSDFSTVNIQLARKLCSLRLESMLNFAGLAALFGRHMHLPLSCFHGSFPSFRCSQWLAVIKMIWFSSVKIFLNSCPWRTYLYRIVCFFSRNRQLFSPKIPRSLFFRLVCADYPLTFFFSFVFHVILQSAFPIVFESHLL